MEETVNYDDGDDVNIKIMSSEGDDGDKDDVTESK